MRMRKKKHRDARIEARADLHFNADFSTPVFLEIGCGKGGFICQLAQNNPELNFVAVERNPDVILLAMERAANLGLKNVRFLMIEARNMADYFSAEQVAGIYLNFSDPWHKNYQAHKRLTYKAFLEIYKKILIPGAKLVLKTDNEKFFDFSVRSLSDNGFEILNQTRDLYSSEFSENNVQTEYENKFVAEGIEICRVEAVYIK